MWRWINQHDMSVRQEKFWVPNRNRTHDLPNTGRALYPLCYENSRRARSFNWVLLCSGDSSKGKNVSADQQAPSHKAGNITFVALQLTVVYYSITCCNSSWDTYASLFHKIELYKLSRCVIKSEEPGTTGIHKTDGQGRLQNKKIWMLKLWWKEVTRVIYDSGVEIETPTDRTNDYPLMTIISGV